MTDNTQPEAMRLANVCSNLTRYSMDAHLIAAELRRQHARIAELEAQIEALSGVQALSAASPPAEQQAAPKAAPGESLTRDQIREVFMAHGFTVKEGHTDLKQYVYDAAYALLAMGSAPKAAPGEPGWWRKRADEIEAQVAMTGSPEAMRCYTDMRALLHAATEAAPQPAPAPLSERDAFEAAWEKLHGKRPVLWSRVFAEHKMETPSHSEGKYFARDEQAAWKLWQARAALAAQGGKDAG